jgi:hypothetical protein
VKIVDFRWAPGSRYPEDEAPLVGKFLWGLRESLAAEGLTPEQVLDAARDPESVLHGYFTWDDKRAAEEHRHTQAGELLRALHVEYIDLGPERRSGTMRALVNLVADPSDEKQQPARRLYMPVIVVLTNEDRRDQMVNDALDEAIRYRRRYAHVKELADIFAAITRVEKKMRPEKKREHA